MPSIVLDMASRKGLTNATICSPGLVGLDRSTDRSVTVRLADGDRTFYVYGEPRLIVSRLTLNGIFTFVVAGSAERSGP